MAIRKVVIDLGRLVGFHPWKPQKPSRAKKAWQKLERLNLAIQVPDARLAGVFNMGGSAVANYASILEPLR